MKKYDQNYIINKKIPHFSWGGTTPRWSKEASRLKQFIEFIEEKKKKV